MKLRKGGNERARLSSSARSRVKGPRRYTRERRIVITEAGLKTRGSIRPCEARSSISIVVSGSRRCLPFYSRYLILLVQVTRKIYWLRVGAARSSMPTKEERSHDFSCRGSGNFTSCPDRFANSNNFFLFTRSRCQLSRGNDVIHALLIQV